MTRRSSRRSSSSGSRSNRGRSAEARRVPLRTALRLEALENRSLMAVLATLDRDGTLEITVDESRDAVVVEGNGARLSVTDGLNSFVFDASEVAAIHATSLRGVDQSIQFVGAVGLSRELTVASFDAVEFVDASVHALRIDVDALEKVTVDRSSLDTDLDLELTARAQVTEATRTLLGATAIAHANLDIVDSHLGGNSIIVDALADVSGVTTAADDEDDDRQFDLSRLQLEVIATVVVRGRSDLFSSTNILLHATTRVDAESRAESQASSDDPARDAAAALARVTSQSLVQVSDRATLDATGAIELLASDDLAVTNVADGSTGGATAQGGTLARTVLDAATRAVVDGDATFRARTVAVLARSTNSLETRANSTAGGATNNGDETSNELQSNEAQTSSGQISLSGAAAFTKLDQRQTTASIETTGQITASEVTVDSDASLNVATEADGSATAESAPGVGVAVAITRGAVEQRAIVGGATTVDAEVVRLRATAGETSALRSTAKSGASAGSVGVAGSFALQSVSYDVAAIVPTGANVSFGSADVSMLAQAAANWNANAFPAADGATGEKVGVGASVAVQRATLSTRAAIDRDANVSNVGQLDLTANSAHHLDASAQTGAAGGLAVTPGAAIAVIRNTTTAELASGSPLVVNSGVVASAIDSNQVSTSVDGVAAGTNAAIGGSFALTDATSDVLAQAARNVTAGGPVTLSATSSAQHQAAAQSSAVGTSSDTDTRSDADSQIAAEQAAAGSDQAPPSAATSAGKVGIAAAVAVNLTRSETLATVAPGISITTPGIVTLRALANADGAAVADGSATGAAASGPTRGGGGGGPGPAVGIGVAVALQKGVVHATASPAPTSRISAGGLTLDTGMTLTSDSNHQFTADATSGAGAGNVGIAGSLALNLVDAHASSAVPTNAQVILSGGDLIVTSRQESNSTSEATPMSGGATGDKLGVGASVALNLVKVGAESLVADGATVTGARNVQVESLGIQFGVAHAEGGAGAEGTSVAITPVVAISLVEDNTTASIEGVARTLVATGNIDVHATHFGGFDAQAEGSADADKAAIGASLALASGTQAVQAEIGSVTATGTIDVRANSSGAGQAAAEASAAGGTSAGAPGDVDAQIDAEKSTAETAAGQAPADQQADAPAAATSRGKLAVAGAVAVNLLTHTVAARSQPSATVTSTLGDVSLVSIISSQGLASADGSAVLPAAVGEDASGLGVGVAVAINRGDIDNVAELGASSSASGRTIQVRTDVGGGDAPTSPFRATAVSGAGNGNVGIAGSLAINKVDQTSRSSLAAGALANASHDVVIASHADVAYVAQASPADGGATDATLGIGASVSLQLIDSRVEAVTAAGAQVRAGRDLELNASQVQNVTTSAVGGAGAEDESTSIAITPVVAVALVDSVVRADLPTAVGGAIVGRDTRVLADQGSLTTTTATGAAQAERAGVGLALALNLGTSATSAEVGSLVGGGQLQTSARSFESFLGQSTASARGGQAGGDADAIDQQVAAEKTTAENAAGQAAEEQQEDAPSASTSKGTVSVAGAVGVNLVRRSVSASTHAGSVISVGGPATIETKNLLNADVQADGSAVQPLPAGEDPSGLGVAAAVAIQRVDSANHAQLGASSNLQANGVTVQAGLSGLRFVRDTTSASAESGAGAGNIGVAGSLAINRAALDAQAIVPSSARVHLAGGDLTIQASGSSANVSDAHPADGGATGATLGIGASVALHLIDGSTRAEIEDGAQITGLRALRVEASDGHAADTFATAGAGAADGSTSVAIAPVAGVTLMDNATFARVGDTSLPLTASGSVIVAANHVGSARTDVRGAADAQRAGIGLALALNSGVNEVRATIGSVTAGGSVDVSASSLAVDSAHALASAKGGEASEGAADDAGAIDAQIEAEQSNAEAAADKTPSETEEDAPSAETSRGKLSVAGAVAVNLTRHSTLADIRPAALVQAGGSLDVHTNIQTVSDASADGSAVQPPSESEDPSGVGIAAAVAINRTRQTNVAQLGAGSSIVAHGIAVRAGGASGEGLSTETAADATSGAGAGNVGLAGSLAINRAELQTAAAIGSSVSLDARLGAVTITAVNHGEHAGEALPQEGGTTGESLGIGASVALQLIDTSTHSELPDGTRLLQPGAITIRSSSSQQVETEAVNGAGAEDASGAVAITPVVAVSLVNNEVKARLGQSVTPFESTGSVTVEATHLGGGDTVATGTANADRAAIGLSLALRLGADEVSASASTFSAQGEAIVRATGSSEGGAQATASSRGGEATAAPDGVDQQISAETEHAESSAGQAPGSSGETPSAETSRGKLSVAGAVAVNRARRQIHAMVEDGATVVTGGRLAVEAIGTSQEAAEASGATVQTPAGDPEEDPRGLGVAAAVAINRAEVERLAQIGVKASVQSRGLSLEAALPAGQSAASEYSASAVSGAGAGNVGLAGSLAINRVDNTADALIAELATVDAGEGNAAIVAGEVANYSSSATPAQGGATGATLGIGASVALNLVDSRTRAEALRQSSLANVGQLDVTANVTQNASATAINGAGATDDAGAVAITPVVAVSLFDNQVVARLNSQDPPLVAGSNVRVAADEHGTSAATATGTATGERAAIGIAVAIQSGHTDVIASIPSLSSAGAVQVVANSTSASLASATAGARGGDASAAEDGVDQAVDAEKSHAESTAEKTADETEEDAPSAKTSRGTVSVAGAVGVNLARHQVLAETQRGSTIQADGTFETSAHSQTDAAASADGSTTQTPTSEDDPRGLGVAAAVAINRAEVNALAVVRNGSRVEALGVTVATTMSGGTESTSDFAANARSGAGAGNVGLAGSLAINKVEHQQNALVEGNSSVASSGPGAVTIHSASAGLYDSHATPAPGGATGATLGIGASVALNLVETETTAIVGSATHVNSGGPLQITADASQIATTVAEGGAGATDGSTNIAVTPVVGISRVRHTTAADASAVESALTAAGAVTIAATHTGETTTTATGGAAADRVGVGVALALNSAVDDVRAQVANLTTSGAVTISATSPVEATAAATASAQGGETTGDEGAVDEEVAAQQSLADELAEAPPEEADEEAPSAQTSKGKLSVAGAVAVNLSRHVTRAAIVANGAVDAGGLLTITTDSQTVSTSTADGSTVQAPPPAEETGGAEGSGGAGAGEEPRGVGVAVAVAIDRARSVTESLIGAGARVDARGVTIENQIEIAEVPPTQYTATATSGAGAGNVGLAGSLALNLVETRDAAIIGERAVLNLGDGDLNLSGAGYSSSLARSQPAEDGTSGATLGIGASVGINITKHDTIAEVSDDAIVTEVQDAHLNLVSFQPAGVIVDGGASATKDDGGVAIAPAVGINRLDSNSRLRIGSTPSAPMRVQGDLTANVTEFTSGTLSVDGSADANRAALGASVAVNVVTIDVAATIGTLTAGGDVLVAIDSSSSANASAKASAQGGETTATAAPESDVDQQVASELSLAGELAGEDAEEAPPARTSQGKVSVSGAVAVNLATIQTRTGVESNGLLTAGGRASFVLDASNGAGAGADAAAVTAPPDDASSDEPRGVGVAAAVAINRANVLRSASIGANAVASANGLQLITEDVPSDGLGTSNSFTATARSGAGSGRVGVAGALALNLINNVSAARVDDGATVLIDSGRFQLHAGSSSFEQARATPVDASPTTGKTGVGASVALNLIDNVTLAEVDAGAGVAVRSGDSIIEAESRHDIRTRAVNGVGGDDALTGVAIAGDVAISRVDNTTVARLDRRGIVPHFFGGEVTILADHRSETNTEAEGATTGNAAAIGASLALGIVHDTTLATADSLIAEGNLRIEATSSAASHADAEAAATGSDAPAGGANVDGQVAAEQGLVAELSGKPSETAPSAKTKDGSVAVAAAVAINLHTASTVATPAPGRTILADGAVAIVALDNIDSSARADGSATQVLADESSESDATGVGVGAAVAINRAQIENRATIPAGTTVTGAGVRVLAETRVVDRALGPDSTDDQSAHATAGAGAGNVGVAGALAINLIHNDATATMSSGAQVSASNGAAIVSADNAGETETQAEPSDVATSGGTIGIGADVALVVANHLSQAAIEPGVVAQNFGDTSVRATGDHSVLTIADGGAAGDNVAVTPVVAIAVVRNEIGATAGNLNPALPLQVGGDLTVESSLTSDVTTFSTGAAEGAVGVGASFSLTTLTNDSLATLRSATISGATTVRALADNSATTEAKASAAGGSTAPASGGVDGEVNAQRNFAATTSGESVPETPSAETSEGKLSVAAAIAISVDHSRNIATISPAQHVASAGLLTVQASHDVDDAARADGRASTSPTANVRNGVGAAVSINRSVVDNIAEIGANSVVSGRGVSVLADTLVPVTDGSSVHVADSVSGAGAANVGVAGSFALNSVRDTNLAQIAGGALVTSGVARLSRDLRVEATNQTSNFAEATADVGNVAAPGAGVGASASLNLVTTEVAATIANNATIAQAANVSLIADSQTNTFTVADAGAAGGTAVSPAVALLVHRNETTARLGTGAELVASGGLTTRADHDESSETQASGAAAAEDVGVGAAVALDILLNDTTATIDRNVSVGGGVDLDARSSFELDTDGIATARGAKSNPPAGEKSDSILEQLEAIGKSLLPESTNAGGDGDEGDDDDTPIGQRITDSYATAKDKLFSQGGVGADDLEVAATIGLNVVSNDTRARIAAQRTVQAGGAVSLDAATSIDGQASADGRAVGGSGVAAALAAQIVISDTEALIGANAVVSGASLHVGGSADGNAVESLQTEAVAGAGANQSGVAGSLAVDVLVSHVRAESGNDAQLTATTGNAEFLANHDVRIQSVAGGGAIGRDSGVGFAGVANILTTSSEARLGAANIANVAGNLSVAASSSLAPLDGDLPSDPFAVAAAGAASTGGAGSGSFTVNVVLDDTLAEIGANSLVNQSPSLTPAATQSVAVLAHGTTTLVDGAGAAGVNLGQSLGLGIGFDVNVLDRDVHATLGMGARVKAQDDITVVADADDSVQSVAATLGLSVSTAIAGAISVQIPLTSTQALVGAGSTLDAGAGVTVHADHEVTMDVKALSAAGSLEAVAAGAAFSTIVRVDTVEAAIGAGASVVARGTSGIAVHADASDELDSLAAGGAGAGGTGIAGSNTLTVLNQSTLSHVDASATLDSTTSSAATVGLIDVGASHVTDSFSLAGAAAAGGANGIGAGVDVFRLNRTTDAWISQGVTANSDGNILVRADASEELRSISASLGVGGSTGLHGSDSIYVLAPTTRATLGDDPRDELPPTQAANVFARGTAVVDAQDELALDLIAGGVGVAGSVTVGESAVVPIVNKVTQATIASNSIVTGEGQVAASGIHLGQLQYSQAPDSTDPGEVRPPQRDAVASLVAGRDLGADSSLSTQRRATSLTGSRRGVVVTATSVNDVETLALTGGVGAGVAVDIGAPVSVLNIDTTAAIGSGAQINTTGAPSNLQSVEVSAASDVGHLGIAGAAAVGGTAGVSPSAVVTVVHQNTNAEIGDQATVLARRDVRVTSTATQDLLEIAVGLGAGGSAGLAGSVAVPAINNVTTASVGNQTTVVADNNVFVHAEDSTDVDAIAGSAGLGISAGVGAAVDTLVIHKQTDATIGDQANVEGLGLASTVAAGDLRRGVIVEAESRENVLTVAASAGVASFAGVAGGVGVTILDSDSHAGIGAGAIINPRTNLAHVDQGVSVNAENTATAFSVSGGLGASLGGSLAGAVDIGRVGNDVQATIGDGSVVKARGDVEVRAERVSDIETYSASGAAGIVGLNAAVSVWSIGSPVDATYSNDSGQSSNALDDGAGSGKTRLADQSATFEGSSALSRALGKHSGFRSSDNIASTTTPFERMRETIDVAGSTAEDSGPSNASLNSAIHDAEAIGGMTARIGAASIQAGRNVRVTTNELVEVDGGAGGGSAGLGALGASIAVLNVRPASRAQIAGQVLAGDNVEVRAEYSESIDLGGLAGSDKVGNTQIGLVALGAAVTVVRDDSLQLAELQTGANLAVADAVHVTANANQTIDTHVGQAAIGVVAAGAAFSVVEVNTTTSATTGDIAVGQPTATGVGSLVVAADSDVVAHSTATATSAGVVGGAINFARTEVSPSVVSQIGAGSEAHVSGAVVVDAESLATGTAETKGKALAAGAALGLARSTSVVNPVVVARIGDSTLVTADQVEVTTTFNASEPAPPVGHGQGAIARGEAASAAIGIAGNSAVSRATIGPELHSELGDFAVVHAVHAIEIDANSVRNADAHTDNFTAGLAAVGGNRAEATGAGASAAEIGRNVTLTGQNLNVESTAKDLIFGQANANSGGLVSGNGAAALASIEELAAADARHFGMGGEPAARSSQAIVGRDANLDLTGNATIRAASFIDADAASLGRDLSGVSVGIKNDDGDVQIGGSSSEVTVSPVVSTVIGLNTSISVDGNLVVESVVDPLVNGNFNVANFQYGTGGDGISTSASHGSTGALVTVKGAVSDLQLDPTALTNIQDNVTLDTAGSLTVKSESNANGAANSPNKTGAFIAVGVAESDATSHNVARTTISNGAALSAAGTADVSSISRQQLDVRADAKGTAFFQVGDSSAAGVMTNVTETVLGPNSQVSAPTVRIQSATSYLGDSDSEADGAGFSSGSKSDAAIRVGDAANSNAALTRTSLDASSSVIGQAVAVTANVANESLFSNAYTEDSGALILPRASSDTQAYSTALVNVATGATLEGTDAVDVRANHQNIGAMSVSEAKKLGIGAAIASATNVARPRSLVDAAAGARVISRDTDVGADFQVVNFTTEAVKERLVPDGQGTINELLAPVAHIDWDADIQVLNQPAPELTVLMISGVPTVTTATGITLTDSDGQTLGPVTATNVSVNDIGGPEHGVVTFHTTGRVGAVRSTAGAITGEAGTIQFRDTHDSVSINNVTPRTLFLRDIDVVNRAATPSKEVTIDVPDTNGSVEPVSGVARPEFGFDVEHTFESTTINLRGSGPIQLSGKIVNPIGSTRIDSNAGSVTATSATPFIETGSLELEAAGAIGSAATPINLEMVQSDEQAATLTANSSTDVFLNVRGHRRGGPAALEVDMLGVNATTNQVAISVRDGVREIANSTPALPIEVSEPLVPSTTAVTNHFRVSSAPIVGPTGIFGVGSTVVPTTIELGVSAGGNIAVSGSTTAGNTVAKGTVNATTAGDITLSRVTGQSLQASGGAGDNVFTLNTFAGSATLNGGADVDHVTLNSFTGVVTTVDTLAVTGDIVTTASSSSAVLNGAIELPADRLVRVANGAAPNDLIVNATVSGIGRLVKRDLGTMTLNGANTLTGQTLLEGGTLFVNGQQPSSQLVLTDGTLGGTGRVGRITANGTTAAIVAPGPVNGPGRLTAQGDLTLTSFKTYAVQLNGTTAASQYDTLDVRGIVTLNNAVLSPQLNFLSAIGNRFEIITNDGADAVVGTFNGLPEGATFTLNRFTYQITYRGGTGNDVVLEHVNTSSAFGNRSVTTPIDEGGVAVVSGNIVDPDVGDTFTLIVNWGDGSAEESYFFTSGEQPISVSHQYLDNPAKAKSFPIALTWVDSHGGGRSDSLNVEVKNVAPDVALSGPSDVVRGQAFQLSLAADDPSAVDRGGTFKYEINWGDGDSETVEGPAIASASHVYSDNGTYVVKVRARDKDKDRGTESTHSVRVSTALLVDGRLTVGGTSKKDDIAIRPGGGANEVELLVNGALLGPFTPTSVEAYGYDDKDTIHVDARSAPRGEVRRVTVPVTMFGGDGNDTLSGRDSAGSVELFGGGGNDTLKAGLGFDLLVGGPGGDTLEAYGASDILIGGSTRHDSNRAAIDAIMEEWTRTDIELDDKVEHLLGLASGGLNGNVRLDAEALLDDSQSDSLYGDADIDFMLAQRNDRMRNRR